MLVLKVAKGLYSRIEKYGFKYTNKGNVIFRLNKDVVQGLTFKRKYVKDIEGRKMNLYELSFSIQPLCNPEAGFYSKFFEGMDVGWCMSPPAFWPFAELTGEPSSLEQCVNQMYDAFTEWVLPYFEEFYDCITASNDIPELRAFKGMAPNSIYFNLKAGKKSAALSGIQRLLQQRKESRDSKAKIEVLPINDERSRRIDSKWEALNHFISISSDEQINAYLLGNEKRAVAFLQENSNL